MAFTRTIIFIRVAELLFQIPCHGNKITNSNSQQPLAVNVALHSGSILIAASVKSLDKVKVVQYGLGPIGLSIAETLLSRPWAELVGAIDLDKSKSGKDVGELLGRPEKIGLKVTANSDEILRKERPDIVTHSTSSSLKTVYSQVSKILENNSCVVSTAEELSYPFIKYPDLSDQIDELARAKHRIILGTGVNPGFLLDFLPVVLSGACRKIISIRAERVVDASRRRFPLQKKIGAGLSTMEFEQKVAAEAIKHVGLPESVGLISLAMGWRLGEIQERLTPVIAEKDTHSDYFKVPKGHVAGIRQVAKGILAGQELVVLDLRMYLGAQNPHDSILIDGDPPLDMTIRGGVHGDRATTAIVVNSIPRVLQLNPGLRTVIDLPPFPPCPNLTDTDRSVMLKTF